MCETYDSIFKSRNNIFSLMCMNSRYKRVFDFLNVLRCFFEAIGCGSRVFSYGRHAHGRWLLRSLRSDVRYSGSLCEEGRLRKGTPLGSSLRRSKSRSQLAARAGEGKAPSAHKHFSLVFFTSV